MTNDQMHIQNVALRLIDAMHSNKEPDAELTRDLVKVVANMAIDLNRTANATEALVQLKLLEQQNASKPKKSIIT